VEGAEDLDVLARALDREPARGRGDRGLEFQIGRRGFADGDPPVDRFARDDVPSGRIDDELGLRTLEVGDTVLPADALEDEVRGDRDCVRGDDGQVDAAQNGRYFSVESHLDPAVARDVSAAERSDLPVDDDDRQRNEVIGEAPVRRPEIRPASRRAELENPFRAARAENDDLRVAVDRQDHLFEVALDEDTAEPQVVLDENDAGRNGFGGRFEPERLPQPGGRQVSGAEDPDIQGFRDDRAQVGREDAFGRGRERRLEDLARPRQEADPVFPEEGGFLSVRQVLPYI